MPRDAINTDHRAELAQQLEQAAATLRSDRAERFTYQDVKFMALNILNECDRRLDYGNPGRAIDNLLEGHNG